MKEAEYPDHKCPKCQRWHAGRYQLCDECCEDAREDEYDYEEDDFNFQVRNRR